MGDFYVFFRQGMYATKNHHDWAFELAIFTENSLPRGQRLGQIFEN